MKTRYGYDCFADDTGLLVDALKGDPGVLSARYAGPEKDPMANMARLLQELEGSKNRKAHFKTVIALMAQGKSELFTGIANGSIINEKRGDQGFGYDPIFVPNGAERTFAEMSLSEKNQISHRAKALEKLIYYLNQFADNKT